MPTRLSPLTALQRHLNALPRMTDGSYNATSISPYRARELQHIMDDTGLLAHGTLNRWDGNRGASPTYLTPNLYHALSYALIDATRAARNPIPSRLHLFMPREEVMDNVPTLSGDEAWHRVIYPLRLRPFNSGNLQNAMLEPLWRLNGISDIATDRTLNRQIDIVGDQYVVPDPLTWLGRLFERKARGGLV